ncbi:MAG TPA: hypothetical protein VK601_21580 [Kofleriaceae bacterium]|nr:hypothetical protein [Kofleriaceae bacterium]
MTARRSPGSSVALVAAAVLAALAAGCGSAASAPEQPAPITRPDDSCSTGDDCDLVDACCGCSAGGKRMAIRRDAVAGFVATHDQRCAGVMCAQMISTDPSCDAEAVCGNRGRCRVAPHMQHQ